jgi:ribosomal protein S18 acetylase RimI-like enzyme
MVEFHPPFRRARPNDAVILAELINFAGEGLPLYLWSKLTEGAESAWDVGQRRASRETGGFSYRNAIIIEQRGEALGALIGYALPNEPEPINYQQMPAIFVPLQELENLAPATWYVNALAVYPPYRKLGYGTQLLSLAERFATDLNNTGLSVIVSDSNHGARRLYERMGYCRIAHRPMVKEEWTNAGENWLLFVKSL